MSSDADVVTPRILNRNLRQRIDLVVELRAHLSHKQFIRKIQESQKKVDLNLLDQAMDLYNNDINYGCYPSPRYCTETRNCRYRPRHVVNSLSRFSMLADLVKTRLDFSSNSLYTGSTTVIQSSRQNGTSGPTKRMIKYAITKTLVTGHGACDEGKVGNEILL
ncbi:hypothetical protein HanRHA438_Chr12g0538351 [Helianthus annuus]|nr:hypothetical protein HanRHA438_Chr12g0538351 [Helianthus annuus]